MRSLLIILLGLVASALGPDPGGMRRLIAPAYAQSLELGAATAEIEALVRQAFGDRLAVQNLPDLALLGDSTRTAVREELPVARLRLSQSALPKREGYEFHLISVPEAESEAEPTQTAIYFITVDRPTTTDDTATIWLGLDVVDIQFGLKLVF